MIGLLRHFAISCLVAELRFTLWQVDFLFKHFKKFWPDTSRGDTLLLVKIATDLIQNLIEYNNPPVSKELNSAIARLVVLRRRASH